MFLISCYFRLLSVRLVGERLPLRAEVPYDTGSMYSSLVSESTTTSSKKTVEADAGPGGHGKTGEEAQFLVRLDCCFMPFCSFLGGFGCFPSLRRRGRVLKLAQATGSYDGS